jgi:hypothetical protein
VSSFTDDDDALLNELGIEPEAKRESSRTPRQERIIAGFEDIQRFVEQHGHAPQHGEHRDIFERLYAARLDRLREHEECRTLLASLDHQRLLDRAESASIPNADDLDDDALLAELGICIESENSITSLRHVRSAAEKREAEEIARRDPCADFAEFDPIFENVKRDLETKVRSTRPIVKDTGFLKADIAPGQFFILGGQLAYVAEVGEEFRAPNGQTDARMRVVYSNATESNLLRRSLQRALYKDEAGRRITEPEAGPLFSNEIVETDAASGTVYVVRSKSDHPTVAAHRGVLHKIGVTGGDVVRRIANASLDPTFLMADVEIVRTYNLYNLNRTRLENLIHRIFGPAQLDIEIKDRFGQPVVPREWFLVPLFVIDEAIEKIRDGTITDYRYDPQAAALRRVAA